MIQPIPRSSKVYFFLRLNEYYTNGLVGTYLTTLRFGIQTDDMQSMLSAIITVDVRPCYNNNNNKIFT